MQLRPFCNRLWRRITTTRLTRALHDEILPHLRAQNAELRRVREALTEQRAQRERVRDDAACVHADNESLRNDNARLREENRALRKSIFATASIPPVTAAPPPAGAQHGFAPLTTSAAAAADAWRDVSHSPDVRPGNAVIPNPAAPPRGSLRAAPSIGADGGEGPAVSCTDARGAHAPPCASKPSGTALVVSGANPCRTPTKKVRDAGALANPSPRIVAPMRRRSWHQIHRALEIAAVRKKRHPEEPPA